MAEDQDALTPDGEEREAKQQELLKLAEVPFRVILDADVHQDNKAGRILSVMAFLTAAAAAIFSKAYSPTLSAEQQTKIVGALVPYVDGAQLQSAAGSVANAISSPPFTIAGINVVMWSFGLYIALVLTATVLYLAALGPSLKLPEGFGRSASSDVRSLLFFEVIGTLSKETWMTHWRTNTPNTLQQEMTDHYLYESWLIAQKARDKVIWMSYGGYCFRAAIFFLIILVGVMFSADLLIFYRYTSLGLAFYFSALLFERCRRALDVSHRRYIKWARWIAVGIVAILMVTSMRVFIVTFMGPSFAIARWLP